MKKTIVTFSLLIIAATSFSQKKDSANTADTAIQKEKIFQFKESQIALFYNSIPVIEQGLGRSTGLSSEQSFQLIKMLEELKQELLDQSQKQATKKEQPKK
jgi:hypothetical protein